MVAVGAGVAASPLFDAKDLSVSGGHELSEERIRAAGGISEETNLIYFSSKEIEERLEEDPWIASASVQRSLPNSLSISVVERIPAAVASRSGSDWLIATDGTTLDETRSDDGLPTIGGVRPGALGEAPLPIQGPAAVAAAFGDPVLEQRPQIRVGPDGQIEIAMKKDVSVVYGDATQPDEKALAITSILAWAHQNHADIISMDVRVPYAPTAVMERNGQPFDSGIIPLSPDPCKTSKEKKTEDDASPSPTAEADTKDPKHCDERTKDDEKSASQEPDTGGATIP